MQNQESSWVLRGLIALLYLVAPSVGVAQDGYPEDSAEIERQRLIEQLKKAQT